MPGLAGVAEIVPDGFGVAGCARLTNGTVQCWDGEMKKPLPVAGLSGVRALTGSPTTRSHCALLADGGVRCWSSEAQKPAPARVSGLTDGRALVAGADHFCALRANGRVACWGHGEHGQLGGGAAAGSRQPVDVLDLSDVAEIAAAWNSTCARTKSGEVYCWGEGSEGQLGATGPLAEHSLAPVHVDGVTHAKALATARGRACALLEDGTVSCWGATRNDGPRSADRPAVPRFADVQGADIVAFGIISATSMANGPGMPTPNVGTLVTIARPHVTQTTTSVPAVLGTMFGFQFRLRGEPFGEPVAVTSRVVHPPFVDPKAGTVTEQSWQDTSLLGVTADQLGTRMVAWQFGSPEELAPGPWTIQLLRDGKVLAEKAFTVVAAPTK